MAASVERVARRKKPLVGSALPRLAPPPPLHHGAKDFAALAEQLEQPLYPWQVEAAKYLTATHGDKWLYREVAILAARQNGKSSILRTLIIERLRAGHRIMHTAQDRRLPREIYGEVVSALQAHFPREVETVRHANGQEEVVLTSGGRYRIVAPSRDGARGPSNDLVIIDETLAMEDHDFIKAAKPTLIASRKPQILYLSNAGTALSEVLNALRQRSGTDQNLAYLEWSADPERAPDDVAGWLQANPSVGHNPAIMENLQAEYQANLLGGTMHAWEQEYLCRWTVANADRIVTPEEWLAQSFIDKRPTLTRPAMGIKWDPSGGRMAAVLAWLDEGERVTLDVVVDITGSPIDITEAAPKVKELAAKLRVSTIAFDPATDANLMLHMTRSKTSITGRDYASATERFVRLVAGRKLIVHDPGAILAHDLEATTRKVMSAGTAIAVKADAERTNCAAEAAIRAVWAVGVPKPRLMVY